MGEEGVWVAPEAVAHDPCPTPMLEAGAQGRASRPVDGGELARGDGMQPRDHAGDEPYGAAQDQGRRGRLAAGGAALVVAMRPEQLLEPVVGPWQVFDPIAVEQARSPAGGDLHEAVDGRDQKAGLAAPLGPSCQEALVAGLDTDRIEPGPIAKDMGGRAEPTVGAADVRPEGAGARQAARDESRDPPQRAAQSPFCSTRRKLPAIASSRVRNRNPAGTSGGRPSSVSAERTAAA